MKQKLTDIVFRVLNEKNWGIFFKNEPVQSLPVQDKDVVLYKVNSVKKEQLYDAISEAMEDEVSKWEEKQGQNQTENEQSNGTKKMY